MTLFKQLVLRESIEIKTTPEKILEFFTNLEQNYKTWHPEDHISLVSPKVEWQIEPKGSHSVFTAITYMRLGRLFQKIFKKEMKKLIKAHNEHVGTEGENLKKILEK